MTGEYLTIDEILLELGMLKEKHGGHVETNIDLISWMSPTKADDKPVVNLINTGF